MWEQLVCHWKTPFAIPWEVTALKVDGDDGLISLKIFAAIKKSA